MTYQVVVIISNIEVKQGQKVELGQILFSLFKNAYLGNRKRYSKTGKNNNGEEDQNLKKICFSPWIQAVSFTMQILF